MTILPERFVRFAIRDLEKDIKDLDGFVALGNEIDRQKEYKKWLKSLKKYYKENKAVYDIEKVKDEEEFRKSLTKLINKTLSMY